jgi:hypothetical protein
MSEVIFSNNVITGSLPPLPPSSSLTREDLLVLSLDINALTGSIPTYLTDMTWLRLDIRDNDLTGNFSVEFCSPNASGVLAGVSNNPSLCYPKCWTELFPTDIADTLRCTPQNVTSRSAPSSNGLPLTRSQYATIIGIVGFVVLVILLILLTFLRRMSTRVSVSPEMKEKLNELPVHKGIINLIPAQQLSEIIASNIHMVMERDYDGKTAVDLIVELAHVPSNVTADILYSLVTSCLFFDLHNEAKVVEPSQHGYGWQKLIQSNDDVCVEVVDRILHTYRAHSELFASAQDERGRESIHIACPRSKLLIKQRLYLWSRYELFPGDPEHISETCIVRFAVDHSEEMMLDSYSKAGETMGITFTGRSGKKNGKGKARVAIKFMKDYSGFMKETKAYSVGDFSDAHVITFLCYVNSTENSALSEDIGLKGYAQYPYCIVMEAGNNSLFREVHQQHFAGVDWTKIRNIFGDIVLATSSLHSRGFIHGDLKPMNVMLVNGSTKLIDFDAACCFTAEELAGVKISTAYAAPELFVNLDGVVMIRQHEGHENTHPCSCVTASPSLDMWSLGVILYFLSTGNTIFLSTVEDNLSDKEDKRRLMNWSRETKAP